MSLIPNDGSVTDDKTGSFQKPEQQPHQGQLVVPTSAFTSSTHAGATHDSKSVSAWLEMMMEHNPPLPTPSVEECEPSADITLTLSPVQKQWLKWCLDQEASEIRGGILNSQEARENRIQAISLVVNTRHLNLFPESDGSSSLAPKDRCTLLICPAMSLNEWKKEIEDTVKGNVSFLVFHGTQELSEEIDFRKYDFVITTYSTLLLENQKYLINSQETAEDKNEAKVEIHANKKAKIMVTSLLSGTWERIILDMPSIKNLKCNTAESLFKLKSNYKWVINSTTRLRDRLEDLYPLVFFLKVFPYTYMFCMKCDCRNQGLSKCCDVCKHCRADHAKFWKKYIENARRVPDIETTEKLKLKERLFRTVMFERNT